MGDKIVTLVGSKIVPNIAIFLVIASALSTSAFAGIKLIQTSPKFHDQIALAQNFSELTPTPKSSPIPERLEEGKELSDDNENIKTPKPTSFLAAFPKASILLPLTSPTNKQTANSNNCIITLFGQQYDITTLLTTHSGGNIFNCGSDMTSVYQGRHGTNVSRMQKYLVSASGTSSSSSNSTTTIVTSQTGTTSTSTNTSSVISQKSGDDDERKEAEEEEEHSVSEKGDKYEKDFD